MKPAGLPENSWRKIKPKIVITAAAGVGISLGRRNLEECIHMIFFLERNTYE